MMVEELMIGDWIYCGNHTIKVSNVINADAGIIDFENNDEYGTIFADNINPIPITSEILEKNGFKLGSNGWECETEKYDILIVLEESHNYIDVTTPFCGHDCERIQEPLYVHQVQHILRDCNIDKEIIL